MSKLRIALVISLAMHIAVIVALLINGHFSMSTVTPEAFNPQPIIEAKVIDENQFQEQVQKVKDEQTAKRLKEENRVKELERRAEDAGKKRKQQEDKKNAEQAAVAAREKQKQEKAKAKAKAKAKQLEDDRKRKELEKKKADEHAKQAKEKREREEKALKEAELKRQEAKEKAEQEKLLDEQLQAEQATRQERRNKQVLSEVQKYQALIKQTIKRYLLTDDAMKGKSCRFNIRLASNGLVIQVKELGGDPLVCRAGKAAILKAVELPVSSEPDVYEQLRDINFTFAPDI
jgi:colicin import membrane protein